MIRPSKKSPKQLLSVSIALALSLAIIPTGCGGNGSAQGAGTGNPITVPPYVILYSNSSDFGATSNLIQVNPDGSGKKQLLHLPENYQGIALNLAVPGEKIFGYSPSSGDGPTYGLYRNSSISTTGMVQIVPPTYSFIASIQVSSDGAWVYFVAAIGTGDSYLYKVATKGGTPIVLDNSSYVYTANVDTVNGSKITYDKDYVYPDGTLQSAIFVRSTSANAAPTLLIDDSGANYGCPQFSPDGTKIAFVSDKDDANMEVYLVSASGGSIVQMTNAPSISKVFTGVTFSPDGSSTAFIGLGSGLYRTGTIGSSNAPSLIVSDSTVLGGIYWTGNGGRSEAIHAHSLSRHLRRVR
jgi:hypothetical protein